MREVEQGVSVTPTTFIATYRSERPVIGINGKYDALPRAKPELPKKAEDEFR